jgi:lysophospholipase L1-like esterase
VLVRLITLFALFTVAGAAASQASVDTPKRYYLALGDSLAYGIQPDKVDRGLPPSGFDTGYVDVFATRLRTLAPKIRVVNYGCPGESTVTFVKGGCPWLAGGHALHDTFRGSQLGAALTFLGAHRGQVSPVTLTLGANDESAVFASCRDIACIRARAPKATAQYASRLRSILGRLRAAAPTADLIVTGLWDTNDLSHLRLGDPLFKTANSVIAGVVRGEHGRFADVFPIFNPQGSLAREKARVCALTFICSRGDGHPTDAGYRAIAAVVWTASGYGR